MSPVIKQNNLSVKSRYRPEIDGLRAFAVIAVIINHINKDILPNGYLGVDIFFVISGFVITSSLYQRESKNFKDFISGFEKNGILLYFNNGHITAEASELLSEPIKKCMYSIGIR